MYLSLLQLKVGLFCATLEICMARHMFLHMFLRILDISLHGLYGLSGLSSMLLTLSAAQIWWLTGG